MRVHSKWNRKLLDYEWIGAINGETNLDGRLTPLKSLQICFSCQEKCHCQLSGIGRKSQIKCQPGPLSHWHIESRLCLEKHSPIRKGNFFDHVFSSFFTIRLSGKHWTPQLWSILRVRGFPVNNNTENDDEMHKPYLEILFTILIVTLNGPTKYLW